MKWQDQLAEVAAASDLPLALVDEWRVVYANPAFARAFAASGDDARKIFDTRQVEQLRWLLRHESRESDKVVIRLARGAGAGAGRQVMAQLWPLGGRMWLLSVRTEYSDDRLADVDPLTRLPNRRKAEFLLGQEWARIRRGGGVFCVALGDIDHFKRVNDEHGHQTGDLALRQAAVTLDRAMRSADWCARWGGEEFMLFLADIRAADSVRPLERIRRQVEEADLETDPPLKLTMSFGVAECDDETELNDAIARADEYLYEAKRAGRNRVFWKGGAGPGE